jgi:hypothetical protein
MKELNEIIEQQSLKIEQLEAKNKLLNSCWGDTLESNFRALSMLTDPEGLVSILLELQSPLADAKARKLLEILCDLQRQVTFTGRCLNGVMSPNKSLYTDQRVKDPAGFTSILVDTSDPTCGANKLG